VKEIAIAAEAGARLHHGCAAESTKKMTVPETKSREG